MINKFFISTINFDIIKRRKLRFNSQFLVKDNCKVFQYTYIKKYIYVYILYYIYVSSQAVS